MVSKEEKINELLKLIGSLKDGLAKEELNADTKLFKGGLLNSMNVLKLISYVERTSGKEIPDEKIVMSNFETPRKIVETFLNEADSNSS